MSLEKVESYSPCWGCENTLTMICQSVPWCVRVALVNTCKEDFMNDIFGGNKCEAQVSQIRISPKSLEKTFPYLFWLLVAPGAPRLWQHHSIFWLYHFLYHLLRVSVFFLTRTSALISRSILNQGWSLLGLFHEDHILRVSLTMTLAGHYSAQDTSLTSAFLRRWLRAGREAVAVFFFPENFP